ncbi:bifunctional 5,10-methylenetetrahydrofolate dehydrogenase/5,10-methenyltetrahydrofolate cyclohydrolase [Xylocopilactobacillus apis]|uniref:Bifunctional protein FolD n=1 Tax=Xylocopilactobacillus apis TaxID=2932183 RepID=A0AAU9DKP8_9LACO|nr:tetrahydrofolate dehydrogenase/cyclohydrolase catalytic domain-containing protein [Xylocopilactobacillus apis]BDR56074.1 bifunctional protein FolD [Xylocopilactobacillus apis]
MDKIIDGKKAADEIAQKLQGTVASLKHVPVLQVLVLGDNPESEIYVRNKKKRALEIGIKVNTTYLNNDVDEEEVLSLINTYNLQPEVTGIMVQLPLPPQISYSKVVNSIDPLKDMDGFSEINVGKLWTGVTDFIAPATPVGIMNLLDFYHFDVSGKQSVIVGRSNIVGKPLAGLLLNRDSTVTICHSKTQDLQKITKQADFLFVAIGKPEFIDASYVKEGAVIVDVGINRTKEGLKGDVNFTSVLEKCSSITPVPKGVGPMTVITLMQQIVNTAKLREVNG